MISEDAKKKFDADLLDRKLAAQFEINQTKAQIKEHEAEMETLKAVEKDQMIEMESAREQIQEDKDRNYDLYNKEKVYRVGYLFQTNSLPN